MYSTEDEILEVVDSNDSVVGTARRAEIHRLGLLHRAVHIFVFNVSGQIYVQRRSASKDMHPSKLGSSAAGHVDPGETYEQTAIREFEEELGISEHLTEILRVAACAETDNEHVVLYRTTTDADPHPNPDEIQWGGFMNPEQLTSLMKQAPEDFVPGFTLLWKEYLRNTE